jgi:hypothetical protein
MFSTGIASTVRWCQLAGRARIEDRGPKLDRSSTTTGLTRYPGVDGASHPPFASTRKRNAINTFAAQGSPKRRGRPTRTKMGGGGDAGWGWTAARAAPPAGGLTWTGENPGCNGPGWPFGAGSATNSAFPAFQRGRARLGGPGERSLPRCAGWGWAGGDGRGGMGGRGMGGAGGSVQGVAGTAGLDPRRGDKSW